jgi:hypothetical protein
MASLTLLATRSISPPDFFALRAAFFFAFFLAAMDLLLDSRRRHSRRRPSGLRPSDGSTNSQSIFDQLEPDDQNLPIIHPHSNSEIQPGAQRRPKLSESTPEPQ